MDALPQIITATLATFLGTLFVVERALVRFLAKNTEHWATPDISYVRGDVIHKSHQDGTLTYIVAHVEPGYMVVMPTLKTVYILYMKKGKQ